MIRNSTQRWTAGQSVKVGFLTLTVKAAIATPGDGLPDAYLLTNAAGDKLYRFVPHNGLERIDLNEVRDLITQYERATARAFQRADQLAEAALAVNTFFAQAAA